MTLPRASKPLLMDIPSLIRSPTAAVRLSYQEVSIKKAYDKSGCLHVQSQRDQQNGISRPRSPIHCCHRQDFLSRREVQENWQDEAYLYVL